MAQAHFDFAPASRKDDGAGDEVVYRCSALALIVSLLSIAAGGFGCADQVFSYFVADVSWLVLAPALLTALLSSAGLCVSKRSASSASRLQFAVFLLALAVAQGAAGVFAIMCTGVSADWIVDGCVGFRTLGLWTEAGRLDGKMKDGSDQYALLRSSWERCRALNPLVYDLAACGKRARCFAKECGDEQHATQVPMYSWFQHMQLNYGCGGFCDAEVPVFGLRTLGDTLVVRTACADKASDWVGWIGSVMGMVASGVALVVTGVSFALFCAATRSDEDFEAIALSDDDDDYGDDRGYASDE